MRKHARARVRARTHRAGQAEPRLSANSRLGPAAGPALQAPRPGTKLPRPPRERGARRGPVSSDIPGRCSVPKGLRAPEQRGEPGWGPQPLPAAPPPLTCSALCGSSGARQPGRRRTGFRRRRRRCRRPRPAGSRWWSPHGSAGPAAAAAAGAAAAAPGESSRRRQRRGGDQKATGRIVRRLRPGNAQRTRPGGRGPRRRRCGRSRRAGGYPRLLPPSPPSRPLAALQSQGAHLAPPPPTALALPEPRRQVLARPAKWP